MPPEGVKTKAAILAWSKLSRHARGYGASWDRLRKVILAREPLCRTCTAQGRVTVATHVDHIKPKAKGGTDEERNLQPLCAPCHELKTAKESAEANGGTYRPRQAIGPDGWPV